MAGEQERSVVPKFRRQRHAVSSGWAASDWTDTEWSASGEGIEKRFWYGVASSRLGRPVERRGRWFQLLERVVQAVLADDAALMVVHGTTAAEWSLRAAQLFGCPVVEIVAQNPDQRDSLLVELADRLYVLRARKRGLVQRLVGQRLQASLQTAGQTPRQTPGDAIDEPGAATEDAFAADWVRVAVWPDDDDGAAELVSRGAIGWYLYSVSGGGVRGGGVRGNDVADFGGAKVVRLSQAETRAKVNWHDRGEWLIHCTRGRSGPMPGQTIEQWRDEVLLGGEGASDLGPIEILKLILLQQRLRGCPLRSDGPPVVCLADVPLDELLSRRTFRAHQGRWDYEPFGVGIRRCAVERLGGTPVVYGDSPGTAGLAKEQKWLFQACGKTYDWRDEREWRVLGSVDFAKLSQDELFVFAGDTDSANELADFAPWPVIVAPVTG